MELIERGEFLISLEDTFEKVKNQEGHCVLIAGETGVGKTSVVKKFLNDKKQMYPVYIGSCDALFIPRPLGPLFDILLQMNVKAENRTMDVESRSHLFSSFLETMRAEKGTAIVVIEDIHCADEATLDFITFFGKRISQVCCLFLLTYRDNELQMNHPLRTVLGQLLSHSATRITLSSFSRKAVQTLAFKNGYEGEDIYNITGGNPFYVSEILASYSTGVPATIKDSILSSFIRQDGKTRRLWEILSACPNGFELAYLESIEPGFKAAIHDGLDMGVLILNQRKIFFRHELFRRTLETSLSAVTRISVNKRILDLYKQVFHQKNELERIIHHAKNSEDAETLLEYAPLAARRAAMVGSHIEACKLYQIAIEYYSGEITETLIQLYDACAYEFYLINRVKDAIVYQQKAFLIWMEKGDPDKVANSSRFLSRLWWFDGNRTEAENYGKMAVEVLANRASSRAKALALSNMCQLKVFSDEISNSFEWGTRAIEIAKEIGDDEVLCHALISVGSAKWRVRTLREEGKRMMLDSLGISLKNSFQEQAARTYSNLVYYSIQTKDYELARQYLEESINYCEERDLNSSKSIKLLLKARLLMDTGNWNEADTIARNLLANKDQARTIKVGILLLVSTIEIFKGRPDSLENLREALDIAFATREYQRIIPALISCLQYEWMFESRIISDRELSYGITLVQNVDNECLNSEFIFWLKKSRNTQIALEYEYEPYDLLKHGKVNAAATFWEKKGCPFDKALALISGNDDQKKDALAILQYIGATGVYEKVKRDMRASGVKRIPRGIRESTKTNPAFLTNRELDVLQLLKKGIPNKEIADTLFISAKTVDHHISSIFFKLNVNSRVKAVQEALKLDI